MAAQYSYLGAATKFIHEKRYFCVLLFMVAPNRAFLLGEAVFKLIFLRFVENSTRATSPAREGQATVPLRNDDHAAASVTTTRRTKEEEQSQHQIEGFAATAATPIAWVCSEGLLVLTAAAENYEIKLSHSKMQAHWRGTCSFVTSFTRRLMFQKSEPLYRRSKSWLSGGPDQLV